MFERVEELTYSPQSSTLGRVSVQVPLTLSAHSSSSERVGTHTAESML